MSTAPPTGPVALVMVLPPPCPLDVPPLDFGHAGSLMAHAEGQARAFLDGRDATVVPLRAAG